MASNPIGVAEFISGFKPRKHGAQNAVPQPSSRATSRSCQAEAQRQDSFNNTAHSTTLHALHARFPSLFMINKKGESVKISKVI
jgi:hypothetical protein